MQLPNLKWCQGHRVTVTQIRFSLEVWLLGDSALGEDGTVLLKAEYCPALSMMGEQAIKTWSARLYGVTMSPLRWK